MSLTDKEIDWIIDMWNHGHWKNRNDLLARPKKKRTVTMKKRQIMRESDFEKLPKTVLNNYRVDFKPLSKPYFEKRATYFYLKGKKYVGDQYAHSDYPKDMLKRFTGIHFYKSQMKDWLYRYDATDQLVVRAGLRQPESRVGLATFRKKDDA